MIKLIKYTTNPFKIFGIRGMFSDSEITLMRDKFPSDLNLFTLESNGKFSISDGGHGMYMLKKDQFWKKIFNKFSDNYFLKELFDFVELDTKSRKSFIVASVNPLLNFFYRVRGKKLIDIRFQFSLMSSGSFIVPHTDSPDKLITLCIYVPNLDQDGSEELGTNFYSANSNKSTFLNWENNHLAINSVEHNQFMKDHSILFRPIFSSKEISGFIKNDKSWHGVDTVNLPVGHFRMSLNVNFNCYRGPSKLQLYIKSLITSFRNDNL